MMGQLCSSSQDGGFEGPDSGKYKKARLEEPQQKIKMRVFVSCSLQDEATIGAIRAAFVPLGIEPITASPRSTDREIAELIIDSQATCVVLSPFSAVDHKVLTEVTFAEFLGQDLFPIAATETKEFVSALDPGLHMLLRPMQWTVLHRPKASWGQIKEDMIKPVAQWKTKEQHQAMALEKLAERLLALQVSVSASEALRESSSEDREKEIKFFESNFQAQPPSVRRRKRVTRKPIFISYPRRCKSLADCLWKYLETEDGMSCWIDSLQREKKELWRTEIGQAIQACDVMIWIVADGEGGSVSSK